MPAAIANLYCTWEDVEHLLSQVRALSSIDDDDDGTAGVFDEATKTRILSYATTRVRFFCCPLYDGVEIASSWLVNEWATVIAAHRASTHRGNPAPQSLVDLLKGTGGEDRGVLGDLRDVKDMKAQIPDLGYRNPQWPAYSNVRVDPRYRLRQIRKQRQISDRDPKQYPQTPDYPSEFAWEI